MSSHGQNGHEVEALEPRRDGAESCFLQAVDVNGKLLWQQPIFNRRTLLSNLEIAVSVGSLEVVMQLCQQLLLRCIFEADFFRQQQSTTRNKAIVDLLDDRIAIRKRDKLQCQVQDDE